MRIWQLAILDDSFDYLSTRYARNVGGAPRPALPPLPVFLATVQHGSDTLTPRDYLPVQRPAIRIMHLPY
jgi:hypothetical protein